ncbi:alpha-hydroxy acid oxidase [Phyllobacterium chamaecytisi]|uniref:alpha-hydroxy acid oxidase n=1 Tax=Phyllobacterium chamaecytisi TaxID=2876082 RepID=UPI001CCC759D|nr:alpha-hydroxy acid oxidase [Phyllobacterium sp. KW56]MBZ9601144.1 alpha-hydroxy-acid oxidizing protein [Phyllobacterium sp. KW56]
MQRLLNAGDFRDAARRALPKALFEYIDRGTEDENALRSLRNSLDSIKLIPSVLTGHPERELRTEILGETTAMPLVVAPTALAGLVSHNGEIKLARAAERMGIPVCISTQSITTIEEIRAGAPRASLWFQLYMWKDRNLSRALLERVEKAGVTTLVVTADTPASPKREYNHRNGFSIPIKYSLRLGLDVALHPRWLCGVLLRYLLATGMPTYGHYPQEFRSAVTRLSIAEAVRLENLLNWDDIHQLRRWWKGKLVIKGVLGVHDAYLAKAAGADGIVVSAHGARNLDIAPAPIDVLPGIADAVGHDLDVLADSGVKRGSDVLKYIANGAKSVMIGRLPLWGLATNGEAGAEDLLAMLRDEIDVTLTMLGLRQPSECGAALQRNAESGARRLRYIV